MNHHLASQAHSWLYYLIKQLNQSLPFSVLDILEPSGLNKGWFRNVTVHLEFMERFVDRAEVQDKEQKAALERLNKFNWDFQEQVIHVTTVQRLDIDIVRASIKKISVALLV